MPERYDFTVPSLGPAKIQSPILLSKVYGDTIANYVRDDEEILYHVQVEKNSDNQLYEDYGTLQKAGPGNRSTFSPITSGRG
jgi:6-phosphofructokinase 1